MKYAIPVLATLAVVWVLTKWEVPVASTAAKWVSNQ